MFSIKVTQSWGISCKISSVQSNSSATASIVYKLCVMVGQQVPSVISASLSSSIIIGLGEQLLQGDFMPLTTWSVGEMCLEVVYSITKSGSMRILKVQYHGVTCLKCLLMYKYDHMKQ